jgi:hypothetical protein
MSEEPVPELLADAEPVVAGAEPEVVADADGRRAAEVALGRGERARTAVWVGEATDPEMVEFRAEIGRRR